MSLGSTLFLKLVLGLLAILTLAICLVALPWLMMAESAGDFDYLPIMAGLYLPAIPFLWALYQAYSLLSYIDRNLHFTEQSVAALRSIKYCALVISGLFILGMPYIFYVADRDDAPGLAAIGFVIIFASLVIATFAAVLQKLIQNAVDIKSENDLTV